MKQIFFALLCSFSLLMLSACGDSNSHTNTSATFQVSLSGDLAGKAISGAGFTVALPANVTPAMAGNVIAASVVTPSGTFAGGTLTPPVYNAATNTIQVVLANNVVNGVTTVGEIATITVQLANNAAPVAANFPLTDISVIDTLGAPVTGMSATVSAVTLQ